MSTPRKKAIVSVINDLVTDQRVNRTCMVLHELGYDVMLVGRKQRTSKEMDVRPYRTHRMRLLFEKGFFFYASFNIRLFFFLLFRKADVLVANDLDTLWPNRIVSKWKGAKLVYDTHEIFCEVPELQHSTWKKNFWKRIERRIFPKLQYVFTVNKSIAGYYEKEYGTKLHVVRNIPANYAIAPGKPGLEGLAPGKKMMILQGSGINVQRGAEEAVQAMQWVNNAVLFIIGGGDVIDELKRMTRVLKLEEKVRFIGKQDFSNLMRYTMSADIGLTLDKDTNINYRFSLPNKIFDYIHAGIAVLASPLVEIKSIVDEFKVGVCIETHDPGHIAEKLNAMLGDEKQLAEWKQNSRIAAEKLNWENEKLELVKVFSSFL
ncbi:MAG TPA: glycosyltransferase [Bacteroidia bacterium]